MPELPEVEGLANALRPQWSGRRVRRIRLHYPRLIAAPAASRFRQLVTGQRIESVGRRAKVICVGLENGATWLIHLRMTGWIHHEDAIARDKHVLLEIDVDGERFFYRDPRRFGRMIATTDPAAEFEGVGPEPLEREFTQARFASALARRTIPIKQALLDPRVVAGIGNIYASEACWRAGLDPARPARDVVPEELARLRREVRAALRQAIRRGAKPGYSEGEFAVYGREGEPCLECRAPIVRAVHGQRSTFFCPACQV